MHDNLFTKEELNSLRTLGNTRSRDRRICKMLQTKLGEPFYQNMSYEEKEKWLRRQAYMHDQSFANPGYLIPGFIFAIIASSLVAHASKGLGLFLLFAIMFTSAYLSYRSNTYFLKNYFLGEAREIESFLQKELEAASHKERQNVEKERKDLEEKARIAYSRSSEIFEEMKKRPGIIVGVFPEYKTFVEIELASASPGQQHLDKKQGERIFLREMVLQLTGTWAEGYVPVNDKKFTPMLSLLEREMARVKELTQYTRLPFQVIEHYQEIARTYYGLHREGGNASIYDEQKITNEVLAMKESLVVHGDYIDKSVSHNNSVTHNTNIANAVIDSGDYSDEKIKKEIIRTILLSGNESASRVELMGAIPVKESRLLAALEDLQQSQKIQIGNRESGEIAYTLDRLA